jgi:hypothetical protein
MSRTGATRDRLNEALSLASKQGALNGPMTLRKAFDAYLAEARSRSPLGSGGVVDGQESFATTSAAGGAAAENEEADGRMRELERKLQELQQQVCYHAGEICNLVGARASLYIVSAPVCVCSQTQCRLQWAPRPCRSA